jgi:hypothetical protein
VCRDVGVKQKEALFLGMLAESYWVSGEFALALAALQRAAEIAEGVTLSHPLVLAQLGALDQAADLLERFRDADPDPDRKAVGRLALARVRWWQEDHEAAKIACADALNILAPTPLPSHVLAAEALSACLDDQPAIALTALRAASVHCSPATYDEIVLDIGSYLVAHIEEIAPDQLRSFLQLSRTAWHRGVRYRVLTIRERIHRNFGETALAAQCASEAVSDVRALADQLDDDFRDVLLTNPWAVETLRAERETDRCP